MYGKYFLLLEYLGGIIIRQFFVIYEIVIDIGLVVEIYSKLNNFKFIKYQVIFIYNFSLV